jgi:hypothetical protein
MVRTEPHWTHVTKGGLLVERYCDDCMLGQVEDFASRTIAGMLDGRVKVIVNGRSVDAPSEVNPERSEP